MALKICFCNKGGSGTNEVQKQWYCEIRESFLLSEVLT